ncbi:MAG: hypothetical protein CMJ40_10365 [Phycisphaerae bacterium]|nr:hypothetical protein [Phycisphaerae bacterium]
MRPIHVFLTIITIISLSTPLTQGRIIRVDPTGETSEYISIQMALNMARPGDEIVLGPGIYDPVVSDSSSWITSNIGTVRQDDIVIRSSHGPASTIIEGRDRLRGIYGKAMGSSLQIEGITFRNCVGAIIASDSEITVRDCIFESCISMRHPDDPIPNLASCIHVERFYRNGYVDYDYSPSNLAIERCQFSNNNGWYGAVRCDSNIDVSNSVFQNNTSRFGGAGLLWGQLWYIYGHDHNQTEVHVPHTLTMTVDHCTFIANESEWHGGGICAYHGHQAWGVNAVITNSKFEENHADDCGGGLYFYVDDSKYWTVTEVDWITPGGIHTVSGRPLTLRDRDSFSTLHGPAPIHSAITLDNCDFEGNTVSSGAGGGAFLKSNDAHVNNSRFNRNQADGRSWIETTTKMSDWTELFSDEDRDFIPRARTWLHVGDWELGTRHIRQFQNELSGMGGGLYVSVHDSYDHDELHSKSMIARDLTFVENHSTHGGGFAMSLSTNELAHRYELELSDIAFKQNNSRTGSAMFVAGTRDATLDPLFLNLNRIYIRDNIASYAAAIQLDAESLITIINDSQIISNLAPVAAILENSPVEFDEFAPPRSVDKRRFGIGTTLFCENSHKDAYAGSPIGWHDMGGNTFGCGLDPVDSEARFRWLSEDIVDWAMGADEWSDESSRDLDNDGSVTAKDLAVLIDNIGVYEPFRHLDDDQKLDLKREARFGFPENLVSKPLISPPKQK